MSELDLHRAALAGDERARASEKQRLRAETQEIDLREREGSCHRAVVHERHDYTEEVWSEPRWVNPRTIYHRRCRGVRDESPYPRMLQSSERGVWVWKQDEAGPPGEFWICRRLIASSSADGGQVNISTEIWKSPPREWPPAHVGDAGSGLNLNAEEARALRDWLTDWLEVH